MCSSYSRIKSARTILCVQHRVAFLQFCHPLPVRVLQPEAASRKCKTSARLRSNAMDASTHPLCSNHVHSAHAMDLVVMLILMMLAASGHALVKRLHLQSCPSMGILLLLYIFMSRGGNSVPSDGLCVSTHIMIEIMSVVSVFNIQNSDKNLEPRSLWGHTSHIGWAGMAVVAQASTSHHTDDHSPCSAAWPAQP